MERDGFMRDLIGLEKYMKMDESIITIGISGINGQVESRRKVVKDTTKNILLEEAMVIDVNFTSHEDLKSSNFECFLYMSLNYKKKHQWTQNTRREERKHI
jgi:hypothetical protein